MFVLIMLVELVISSFMLQGNDYAIVVFDQLETTLVL